ncbi:hypothetical protein [Roseibium sp.]|uniref:hypothetical protein n=2 Tax=Roseibium sp. TaxID=1936156 RepID=UPI00326430E6
MTEAEELIVIAALIWPIGFLWLGRLTRGRRFRRTAWMTSAAWWGAVLIYANVDGNCSGGLIFGYRSCGWIADDTANALALSAVFLIGLGVLMWTGLFFFGLVPALWRSLRKVRVTR